MSLNISPAQLDHACVFLGSFLGHSYHEKPIDQESHDRIQTLDIIQIKELVADVVDEIQRRQQNDDSGNEKPFLEFRPEFSAKRNQGRQRLAALEDFQLKELVYGVHTRLTALNSSEMVLGDLLSSPNPIPIQKVVSRSMTPLTVKNSTVASNQSSNQKLEPMPCVRDTLAFDGLDNMMQELTAMIGKEQDGEVEKLKNKYQYEIAELKGEIERFEQQVLPTKNQEIAKLVAKVDDLELKLMESKKEALQNNQLCQEKEKVIDEQNMLIKSLQQAYNQLQVEVISKSREKLTVLKQISDEKVVNVKVIEDLKHNFEISMKKALSTINQYEPVHKDILYSVKDLCSLSRKIVKAIDQQYKGNNGQGEQGDAKNKILESVTYLITCCKDLNISTKSTLRIMNEALETLNRDMNHYITILESPTKFQSQSSLNMESKSSLNNDISRSKQDIFQNGIEDAWNIPNYRKSKHEINDLYQLPADLQNIMDYLKRHEHESYHKGKELHSYVKALMEQIIDKYKNSRNNTSTLLTRIFKGKKDIQNRKISIQVEPSIIRDLIEQNSKLTNIIYNIEPIITKYSSNYLDKTIEMTKKNMIKWHQDVIQTGGSLSMTIDEYEKLYCGFDSIIYFCGHLIACIENYKK